MTFKYLGLKFHVKGQDFLDNHNKVLVMKAKSYAFEIFMTSRDDKGRVQKTNVEVWSSTIQVGGFPETTPLIVKYLHRGNILYLEGGNG